MGANCGNCRFAKDMDGHGVHCRRYPPTIAQDGRLMWEQASPYMAKDDWCGEHQPMAAIAGTEAWVVRDESGAFLLGTTGTSRRSAILSYLGLEPKDWLAMSPKEIEAMWTRRATAQKVTVQPVTIAIADGEA